MNTVVMAHKGTEDTCRRHWRLWIQYGNVHFVSPQFVKPLSHSMVIGLNSELTTYGIASHHSFVAISRFKLALTTLYMMDPTETVLCLNEYDSFAVSIPEDVMVNLKEAGVAANMFRNVNDPKFAGHQFAHPPLLFTRKGLKQCISSFNMMDDNEEHGFWDRWLGLLLERAGITAYDYGQYGFSKNTIDDPNMAAAQYRNGARLFHGVKSASVFNAIIRARDRRST